MLDSQEPKPQDSKEENDLEEERKQLIARLRSLAQNDNLPMGIRTAIIEGLKNAD